MKKFHIIFFIVCLTFFALMYYSIWWFIGGIGVIMVFTFYRLHAVRLEGMQVKNEMLEQKLERLTLQLDDTLSKELKTTKEVERIKKLKKQLLSVMSHEIRTPMNGIMGMSLLLKETPLTREQQDYNNTICSCGETLLTRVNEILADDMLDLSKINVDNANLEFREFDLRECVEETLDLFAVKAGKTGNELICDMDDALPGVVLGDKKSIQQVLINLLDNALQFTLNGEVCVAVRPSNTAEQSKDLVFEVVDTGTGIPPDQLKQLFRGIPGKDFKSDQENKSRRLGLVVCKRLVHLMGGQIEARSEPGAGSHFTFRIPLMTSLKPIKTSFSSNGIPDLGGRRVLLIENNRSLQRVLDKHMQTWNVSVTVVESAQQALALLDQQKLLFELILIDRTLSQNRAPIVTNGLSDIRGAAELQAINVTTGISLAREIKKHLPQQSIILMNTAGDETYRSEEGLFAMTLSKPIRRATLQQAISDTLSVTNNSKPNMEYKLTDDFSKYYPLKILVAEDNPVNQKVATKMLTKLGYAPVLANNGKEVVEVVSHNQYDVIFMDVQMPEMDGLEATRMIRTCLETQPVIIAMTANVMAGDRDECMQAGMDDYIGKPLELTELLRQLEKWYQIRYGSKK